MWRLLCSGRGNDGHDSTRNSDTPVLLNQGKGHPGHILDYVTMSSIVPDILNGFDIGQQAATSNCVCLSVPYGPAEWVHVAMERCALPISSAYSIELRSLLIETFSHL